MCNANRFLAWTLSLAFCVALPAAEKPQTWLEARTPRFTVITNGSEKQARRVIGQFERIREVFHTAFPKMKVDTSTPILILAAKDQKTFEAMEPDEWKKRGQMKRGGFFLRGPEKNFVLLRLDTETAELYHAVFHEYTHLLVNQNVKSLPRWLDEGLAEFYGNTRILDKEVQLGYPSRDHVEFLRENRMIPLATLFAVDHSSPYYNEEHKGSVFYAQSWVLVHYLMMEGSKQGKNPMAAFLMLVDQDVDATEAGTRAFGDLGKLQGALNSYVHAAGYHFLRLKTAISEADKTLPVRALEPAESAAQRGDFLAHLGEYSDARALLDEAIKLDPANALARESLGFIELRQKNLTEARKWFAEAVKLDSRSHLANYYHAMLTEQEGQDKQHWEEAEASLRRAMELNNQFAPAYGALASVMGRLGKDLTSALAIARRAIQLEPGVQGYHLVAASLLMQMGKVEEGRKIAERLVATAKTPADHANAESLLASIRQYQSILDQRKAAEEQARLEAEKFRRDLEEADRQRVERAEEEATEEAAAAAQVAQTLQPVPAGKGRAGWSAGKMIAVSCKASPALELTLRGTLSTLRLHAANYFKIEFKSSGWKAPDPFDPCEHLQGHEAAISFRTFDGSRYDGEIVSIEIRQ
jgi:tetratricopeptide (TPR) repeat protein